MVTLSETVAAPSWFRCQVQVASVELCSSSMPCPKLGSLAAQLDVDAKGGCFSIRTPGAWPCIDGNSLRQCYGQAPTAETGGQWTGCQCSTLPIGALQPLCPTASLPLSPLHLVSFYWLSPDYSRP